MGAMVLLFSMWS